MDGALRPTFKSNQDLRSWITAGDWTPNSGVTSKKLRGTVHALDVYSEACVRDAIKFGVVAFESAAMLDASTADNRSCAWQFIKYYYSAYYAANGLMRLAGQACMNLNPFDCSSINSLTSAYGVGGTTDKNKIAKGLYYLNINTSSDPMFTLSTLGGKGGVHIQFWSGFLNYLQALRSTLLNSPAPQTEKIAALEDLDLLRSELQRGGVAQASWLSEARNSVNYRFEHSVWFPYDSQEFDKTHIRASFKIHSAGSGRFHMAQVASPDLVRASRCCGYLVGWLRNSIELIANQSKGEKSSLAKGALEFAGRI